MKEVTIDSLDQLIDMLGGSISDISFCNEDIEKLGEDFDMRYPDYSSASPKIKIMLDNIKNDIKLFRKRTYVRTVFSYIEGMLFAMKRILLEDYEDLNDEDIIKLQEYRLVGANAEKLQKKPVFIDLKENMKFTFDKYGKIRANNYQTDFNSNDWENFKKCIKIRNKITHPKHSDDLIVTDEEYKKVQMAHDWFFKILNKLQKEENST
ncbi:MAG: hypothetical protein ABI550_04280 [Ignavibacteriaceae bacterium]